MKVAFAVPCLSAGPHAATIRAAAIAAAALAAATLAGCGGDPRAAATGVAGVHLAASDVAVAEKADLAAGVPVSGTLAPSVEVHITAPVTEILEAVPVREGQIVAKGQVLARFRTASLQPAAASAAAALELAAADHERYQNLYRDGAVSKREVESAEAAWRAAAATEVQARKRLEDAVVRAPRAGVISKRSVQGGDRVADGDPMFELVNTSELEFEATVPSEHFAAVRVGAPVRLTVTGFPAGSITGRVARVNTAADPATRQVQVYVTVPNREGRLVGGLYASGTVVSREARGVLAVPAPAVRGTDAALFVLAVTAGRLARRPVTTGVHDDTGDRVEIVTGLAAGDTVVVGPAEGLSPGQIIEVGGMDGARNGTQER